MDTKDVANFVAATSVDRLPSDVLAKAKMCILDTLGSSLAAQDTKSANCVIGLVRALGGKEESTLVGVGVKVPAPLAAWANSMLASALDIDDGISGPAGHAGHHGSMVVPSSLCLAESQGLTGKSFLEAVVVGYEVGIRAGYVLGSLPRSHQGGPIGSYGVAAASAKLLRLNTEATANTLHIVDAHNTVGRDFVPGKTAGILRVAMTKEKVGWSVLNGVMAALLAREGFNGVSSIYDDSQIAQTLLSGLGSEYEILKVYYKPYCSARCLHNTLDGVLELRQKYNLGAEDIVKVTVKGSSLVMSMNNYRPENIEQAQFSLPFGVGAVLVDGKVGPEQVNERRLGDKAILAQADKVKLEVDPAIDALGSMIESRAIVTIEAKDGRTYETRVDNAKGSIENPFTYDALQEKFRSLSTSLLGDARTEEVISCVGNLEDVSDIRELVDLIGCVG